MSCGRVVVEFAVINRAFEMNGGISLVAVLASFQDAVFVRSFPGVVAARQPPANRFDASGVRMEKKDSGFGIRDSASPMRISRRSRCVPPESRILNPESFFSILTPEASKRLAGDCRVATTPGIERTNNRILNPVLAHHLLGVTPPCVT